MNTIEQQDKSGLKRPYASPSVPASASEVRMSLLFDYYGGLLGERQNQIFSLYHEDDLSLSEIAELMKITRQGVHDALKKAEAQLMKYEDKLGLVERHEAWLAALDKIDPNVASMLEKEVDV
jgi:RNA polymerase sigma factor (sigma-70 family)